MTGGNNSGRVTTRELYDALKEMDRDQSKERRGMEERIMDKIDCIPVLKERVDTNKEEIKQLRRRSDIVDTLEGLFGVAVAIFLGTRE
jgi:hypothetical protein